MHAWHMMVSDGMRSSSSQCDGNMNRLVHALDQKRVCRCWCIRYYPPAATSASSSTYLGRCTSGLERSATVAVCGVGAGGPCHRTYMYS
jgi:hypothetical protein